MAESTASFNKPPDSRSPSATAWWQQGVVYQVYPRSFQDSNHDGVGDLPGITRRLDYLQWLGVDALWISPIYPSPMADFGYDISDYTDVHPLFGTLHHFDQLVEEAHRRHLKVILDYVPNHTSIDHPWFRQSRSDRTNSRRDWYLWKDPAPDGGPPTNWVSNFGGPAWTLDTLTGQYYYHAYLPEQPDLNWRHPDVQQAMLNVLRFWLDRGVDGFRVDALRQLIKDDQWRDNPPAPEGPTYPNPYDAWRPVYTTDRPEVMGLVTRMRSVLDEYYSRTGRERVLIGELYLPIERLVAYYGPQGEGCHLPFNFHLISTPWEAAQLADLIHRYEAALPPGGWPNWVLGNHDQHRLATRLGTAQARVAAMLLLTLRGTPTLYYGDEIGMTDGSVSAEAVQDPWEKRVPGRGLGRDPERTPMQWEAAPNAGFTTGTPWLPVSSDYEQRNVAVQQEDPSSLLSLYRQLLHLRRKEPALSEADYDWVRSEGSVLLYQRTANSKTYCIALNSSHEATTCRTEIAGEVAIDTHGSRLGSRLEGHLRLMADQGVVILKDNAPSTE